MSSRRFGSASLIERTAKKISSVVEKTTSLNLKEPDVDTRTRKLSAQSVNTLPDSANSAETNTANSIPLVLKKQDSSGRDVLIKNLKRGKYEITAGTIDALVASLADEFPPDTIYIETFLLTFRHFTTCDLVLGLLRRRFINPDQLDIKMSSIIRIRVINVVKKWLERHSYDFQSVGMMESVGLFMEEVKASELSKFAEQIERLVKLAVTNENLPIQHSRLHESSSIIHAPKLTEFLEKWHAKHIAQALTSLELKLFRSIKPEEFCFFLWSEKGDLRLKNFNDYVGHFNRVSYWTCSSICSIKDAKKRSDAVEKFTLIMKYCTKYQNFNTLMAIICGLNMNPVARLKKTWEIFEKSRLSGTYQDILNKMSYRGNFKKYREHEACIKPPIIPFFGLYCKDLIFFNDGK